MDVQAAAKAILAGGDLPPAVVDRILATPVPKRRAGDRKLDPLAEAARDTLADGGSLDLRDHLGSTGMAHDPALSRLLGAATAVDPERCISMLEAWALWALMDMATPPCPPDVRLAATRAALDWCTKRRQTLLKESRQRQSAELHAEVIKRLKAMNLEAGSTFHFADLGTGLPNTAGGVLRDLGCTYNPNRSRRWTLPSPLPAELN